MKKMIVVAVALAWPALLAAQMPPAPAQSQPAAQEAKPVMTHRCEKCNETFKSAAAAKRHFVKVHNMKYYCAACSEGFKTKAEMKEHMKTVHPKPAK